MINFIVSSPFQSNITASQLEEFESVRCNMSDGQGLIENFRNPLSEEGGTAEELAANKKANQDAKDANRAAKRVYKLAFDQLKADLEFALFHHFHLQVLLLCFFLLHQSHQ